MITTPEINILYEPLAAQEPVKRLVSRLAPERPVAAINVPEGIKAPLAALIARGRPVLFVTYNDIQAIRLYEDAVALCGGAHVAMLPAREIALYRVAAQSRSLAMRRLDAMHRALNGTAHIVVASIDALLTPMMPVKTYSESITRIEPGNIIQIDELTLRLIRAGYERVDMVEGQGQFAVRGGIVDVFPVGGAGAVRVEFYDDEIDTLRALDVMTQRSDELLDRLVIPPASEAVLRDEEDAREAAARIRIELDAAQLRWDAEGGGENEGEETEETDYSAFFGNDDEVDGQLPSLFDEPTLNSSVSVEQSAQKFITGRGGRLREYVNRLEEGKRVEGIESLLPYLYEKPATMADYLPDNAVILLDEPNHMRERCQNVMLEFVEHLRSAMERAEALPGQAGMMREYSEVLNRLLKGTCAALCAFMTSMDIPIKESVDFAGRGVGAFHGLMEQLADEIKRLKARGARVLLLAGGVARGQRLEQTLRGHGVEVAFRESGEGNAMPGEAVILPPALSHGFIIGGEEGGLCVIADNEIYGAARRRASSGRRANAGQRIAAFTDLSAGDYVVHESHGVGIFEGTVRMEIEGRFRDYLSIRYNGGDSLYVPTDQMDRVQKYIGAQGGAPKMNRLGGSEWNRLKQRVKASIADMAQDLVKLYAQRHTNPGFAFGPDTPWQREFEDSFPYEETPDQLQCIEEIKRDMERPNVMDRLLCGDVGYGKTEVALRAAFKAVMDSKQVAVLVPTTVLAQQHHQTLQKRFSGFPMRVDMLSRFKSSSEQKEIARRLSEGELDIVVGTHRLLAKDVRFKDIGLLIVDEEQRFGVAHKEKLKRIKQNVDVLTLSATPIPRTLHMSMAGIRDMSLIETPPEERYPVQTYVLDYSDSLVRDAVLREIARGGQAYIVYNRVRSIEVFHAHLRQLIPEARIVIGHGQMRETALEDVMEDFFEGRYDVLLCSTIIESGLDVPNCNTLIVCEADKFGLSQLYQLRGRVGRSNRLAYCYLTVNPNRVLSETAQRRLSAIREFTEFGSGFKIAMRDLEIRGAGNILGAEQHGHMSAVGYDMYVKLMDEAIRKLRGEQGIGDIETRVELKVDAYLPEDYVRGNGVRLEVYKRIASIGGKEERDDMLEELIDRFGDVPEPVDNLVAVSYLKALCNKLRIEQIMMRGGFLTMRFASEADIDPLSLMAALQDQKELMLSATEPPALVYMSKAEPEKLMRDVAGHIQIMLGKMGL